jgi:hypothetical protein
MTDIAQNDLDPGRCNVFVLGAGKDVKQHELDSIRSSHHSPVHGDTIDENPDSLESAKFVCLC